MIEPTPDGIIITIRVIPRARRSRLAGVRGEALLVRLQASPVEGAANIELVGILAVALRVPKPVVVDEATSARAADEAERHRHRWTARTRDRPIATAVRMEVESDRGAGMFARGESLNWTAA